MRDVPVQSEDGDAVCWQAVTPDDGGAALGGLGGGLQTGFHAGLVGEDDDCVGAALLQFAVPG